MIQNIRFLLQTVASMVVTLCPAVVMAQDNFPERPVTIVVPGQAGGGSDVIFRKLAVAAQAITNTSFIVLNRPGASATMGTTVVTQAKPDGYTLGGTWNGPLTMAPLMVPVPYTTASYDPVIQISSTPLVVCVHQNFPASSGKEFVEELRKKPNQYTYGADGIGGTIHFGVTRVFKGLGISARMIPFNSSPATMQAFLSRTVDMYGGSVVAIKSSMDGGVAKCLLVSSTEDNPAVPMSTGLLALGAPDSAMHNWYGVIAPKGTPLHIIAKLDSIFRQAAATPSFIEYLQSVGMQATLYNSIAMRQNIEDEYAANALISKNLQMQD